MMYSFSGLFSPARLPAECGAAGCKKRGFNLIESAIVLGVVGLVIGGIWAGAATMYENYKVNKTASDVALIVKNVQKLISSQDAEAIILNDGLLCGAGAMADITTTVMDAGVFPQDWLKGSSIKHPFGMLVFVNAQCGYFSLRTDGYLPAASCTQLVLKITSASVRETLDSVRGYDAGWTNSRDLTLPPTLGGAKTFCANGVYYLGIRFKYTRTN
jgi:type II secretory pathway pseudopilin PulG